METILHAKKIRLLVNPASHSHNAAEATRSVLSQLSGAGVTEVEVYETTGVGDAGVRASLSGDVDALLVLGGDGMLHEAVNGLMRLPAADRPLLGVLPIGTGNDYARTIGMARNRLEEAVRQILSAGTKAMDLGKVNDTYFIETLSFGLDAAVAQHTIQRRDEGTTSKGSLLFLTSSIKLLSQKAKSVPCTLSLDGKPPITFPMLICAFQIGRTYGAGFPIAPDASPTDGLLDVCRNTKEASVPHVLSLLARARFGKHTTSRTIHMDRASRATVSFGGDTVTGEDMAGAKNAPLAGKSPVPVQVDGEPLTGETFEISCLPGALQVLVP